MPEEFSLTPPEVRTTFSEFRLWIERAYWFYCRCQCPWDASEAVQLKRFLAANPALSVQDFKHWLNNYMLSEDHAPGERPRSFIPRLNNYSVEPLDRFGRSIYARIPTAKDQNRAINCANFREARCDRQLAPEDARPLSPKRTADDVGNRGLAQRPRPLLPGGD